MLSTSALPRSWFCHANERARELSWFLFALKGSICVSVLIESSLPTCAVLGQIRTTVCQAQLLMRQKLKQYIGLVGQAEHGGGEQPTKVEDLQGFWDMVYFQVEDILKKFQGLEDLEKNNWKAVSELQSFPKKGKVY